jgi:hypothetical protein
VKLEQRKWTEESGWIISKSNRLKSKAQLVIVFGSTHILSDDVKFNEIKGFYPNANILSCSTAGEISDINVSDETIVCTAVEFEKTKLLSTKLVINEFADSISLGKKLVLDLPHENLRHVFILSDGLNVNGSRLVKSINKYLPANVSVTGGLAGDGTAFQSSLVGLNEKPTSGIIAAIGFYGSALRIGYGSVGGWESVGPERLITKSKANVLYELDNEPAIDIYKKYHGDQASELRISGYHFPLSIRTKKGKSLVRTIVSVDEDKNYITFAGDMPEGSYARLLKADFDRLVDGAAVAAEDSFERINTDPDLAILISSVGRKQVLGDKINEEPGIVRNILGPKAVITGFYSYGEISPFVDSMNCEFHNQTMTITTLAEV